MCPRLTRYKRESGKRKQKPNQVLEKEPDSTADNFADLGTSRAKEIAFCAAASLSSDRVELADLLLEPASELASCFRMTDHL